MHCQLVLERSESTKWRVGVCTGKDNAECVYRGRDVVFKDTHQVLDIYTLETNKTKETIVSTYKSVVLFLLTNHRIVEHEVITRQRTIQFGRSSFTRTQIVSNHISTSFKLASSRLRTIAAVDSAKTDCCIRTVML